MEQWRNLFDSSGEDIWTVIERAIIVALTDYPDQLRMRRDGFVELMYAPDLTHAKSVDDLFPKGSDKTNAMSGVYKTNEVEQGDDDDDNDLEEDPRRTEEEEHIRAGSISDDGEHFDDDEAGNEVVHLDDSSDDDYEAPLAPAAGELGQVDHHDTFDDEIEALNDEIEREKLLLNDIYSIKNSIKDVHQSEAEVMDLLYRINELNISVEAIKATNIGKSVNIYRKHPSVAVRVKTKEIIRSWKDLVDEWMKNNIEVSVNEECTNVCQGEVGLPSPPLDEGGLFAARTVEMSEIFNFTDDDLSACSGPSPPKSDGLSDFGMLDIQARDDHRSDHHHSRTHSRSPDQEHDGRGSKGAARVLKVDKHRPVKIESKLDQNSRRASASSGNIRQVVAVPSGVRPSIGMNNTGSRKPSSSSEPLKQKSDGGVRKSDSRLAPNLGSRPRVESTRPGLSTNSKPDPSEVSENERIEASKKRLHTNYMMHDLAKRQRTVQQLDLTELPKGGPKAQRPGQNRGWVNSRK